MSKALARNRQPSPLVRERENALASILAQVVEDDACVIRAAGRAREIMSPEHAFELMECPDDQLKALGWTRQELQIACDAKMSKRESPFYLQMTHERSLLRYRGEEGQRPFVDAVIVSPTQAPQLQEAQPLPPAPPEGNDETPG
jgi:hypothetical protein